MVELELEEILYSIIFSEENNTNHRFEEVEGVFANQYHSSIFQLHRDHYYVRHQVKDSIDPRELEF